jgi:predicted GIY-YIG superfamily endonuclease
MMLAASTETAQALYRFFDTEGELLYVGITVNPGTRWAEHKNKPWWSGVASATLEQFPSRDAAEEAEITAIRAENPRYNVTHSPRRVGKPLPGPLAENTSVRLPADLVAWLDARATRESRSRSQMIRVLLEQARVADVAS